MRICFLAPQYPPIMGGISTYVHLMTQGLAERGHEVLVVTRIVNGVPRTETVGEVDVCRVPARQIPPLMLSHGVVSSLRLRCEFKPDLLHVNHPGVLLCGRPCGRLVTTMHTTIDSERIASEGASRYAMYVRLTWPFLRGIERDLVRKSSNVICVSRQTASSISRSVPSSISKLIVLYNGVSEKWFKIRRAPLRNLILYVGALTERKGIDVLLRALTTVKSRFPSIELVVVGSGPLKESLKDAAQQLGILENVHFAGSVSDCQLLDLYSKATCLVLPSLYEDCPYSLLQALAAGVPVISTRVGGIVDVLQESGLLVPPRDCSALSAAINRVMGDEALREWLSREGRQLATRKYTIGGALDALEGAYAEVLRT